MTALKIPVLLVATVLLAGCGGTPIATSTPTPSVTTASPTASETPTPTPTPAVVAGFELGGTAVYAVDADGAEITEYLFDEPEPLIAALTGFYGAPEVVPSGTHCDAEFSIWPDEMTGSLMVVVYDSGQVVVVVKNSGYLGPTDGPDFGESSAAFQATLPADQITEVGYVYDPVSTAPGGAVGGVAFVDTSGKVTGLASPTQAYGSDLC